jgi:hypothetical protein
MVRAVSRMDCGASLVWMTVLMLSGAIEAAHAI